MYFDTYPLEQALVAKPPPALMEYVENLIDDHKTAIKDLEADCQYKINEAQDNAESAESREDDALRERDDLQEELDELNEKYDAIYDQLEAAIDKQEVKQ